MDKLIIGCGYLGIRVARLWLAEGQRVAATTRSETRAVELAAIGVEPIVCQVLDPHDTTALPRAQAVLYAVGTDLGRGQSRRAVTVAGLGNLLNRLPAPARFIYISSTGVYGQTQGEEVDETAATEPGDESGQLALEAEGLLAQRLRQALILRFAGIYGPGRLLRRQAIEAGEPIKSDVEKWLNLIHVDDGAFAVLAALGRGLPGRVCNVSDGHPVRRREFYIRLAELLHAPAPRFVLPAADAPVPPHERANRRVVNQRLREELRLELRYPSFEQGLAASLTS